MKYLIALFMALSLVSCAPKHNDVYIPPTPVVLEQDMDSCSLQPKQHWCEVACKQTHYKWCK